MQLTTRALVFVLAVGLCAAASEPDGVGLQPGLLSVAFKTGGPNCVTLLAWEVHGAFQQSAGMHSR